MPPTEQHTPPLPRQDITGLVLAGGRASRMGGVDKGLQMLHGQPLARHALQRLQPQVGTVAINANRHAEVYATWGVPVWPDSLAEFPGPLAGMLAGLTQCATPWLLSVPCDSPHFPPDLVTRLAAACAADHALIAVAAAPQPEADGTCDASTLHVQPVFCLLHQSLRGSLTAFLAADGHKIMAWVRQHPHTVVRFDQPHDDPLAFHNVNTLDELAALGR